MMELRPSQSNAKVPTICLALIATLILFGCGGSTNHPPSPTSGGGTAVQYFSKRAIGNTWTYDLNYTVPAPAFGGSYTTSLTSVSGGVVTYQLVNLGAILTTGTLEIDSAGAWVDTNSWGSSGIVTSNVILPASFSVGTTWTSTPAGGVQSATTSTVTAMNVTRTVPAGTFTDCLQVDSTFTSSTKWGEVVTTTTSTSYFSPLVGNLVETITTSVQAGNGFPPISTKIQKLMPSYLANP